MQDIAELKQRITLAELIERHGVEFKPAGRELKGLCPLHSENTPSFTVNPDQETYYCFGCGSGGDHISFLQEYYNCDTAEAAEKLADMTGGNFEFDAPKKKSPAKKQKPADEWRQVAVVPDGLEPPATVSVKTDQGWQDFPVIAAWAYKDADGNLLGWTTRVEPEAGKKEIIPFTWMQNAAGAIELKRRAQSEPRSLYKLETLKMRPDAKVLLVEGEKAADAANRLLSETDYIALSWAGGGKAISKTDFSPLHGREVIGWPDADCKTDKRTGMLMDYMDQPGMQAMVKIAGLVPGMQIIKLPKLGSLPDGYDSADAEADGWDPAQTTTYIMSNAVSPGQLQGETSDIKSRLNELVEQTGSKQEAIETLAIQTSRPKQEIALALDQKAIQHPSAWEAIIDDEQCAGYSEVNICGKGLLADYARQIAASVQFPINTTYLHALAVGASAMVRRFSYAWHGFDNNPVNLYTVSAQPPGTGKSGVNNYLTNPIREIYKTLNLENEGKRKAIENEIKKLETQCEQNPHDKESAELLVEKRLYYSRHCHVIYSTDDATPEALESICGRQNGMANIISDESDAVNVVLGSVYGSESRKSNSGIFLKMFDGGWHAPSRVTRETRDGRVYGCLAIIAQDESVKSILQAGESGRGISERILMLRERNLLGHRNHMIYTPVDKEIKELYEKTCENLIRGHNNEVLYFGEEATRMINEYRQQVEVELADGGRFSAPMLRGAIGKADKQICKIACILHGFEHWQNDAITRPKEVSVDNVAEAKRIYMELINSYVRITDGQGYTGDQSAIDKLKEKFKASAQKNKLRVDLNSLASSLSRTKPFADMTGRTKIIREKLIPAMAVQNWCLLSEDGKEIYLNPRIGLA